MAEAISTAQSDTCATQGLYAPMSDVTRILLDIEQGDSQAADQLLPLVYAELRKLAAAKLASERAGHTLQIIKAGMDSKQVIARFAAEQQALALMDHPNIAKVLDAGTRCDTYRWTCRH